ncbi:MAG TPA: 3'-5' exonuclease [Geobacteraceae bacterium]
MKSSRKNQSGNNRLNPLEAEIAVTALHATGDFLVLRRLDLERDARFARKPAEGSRIGLCLDTETTGLSHAADKVIELGIVAFEYNPATAQIIRVTGRYGGFEDPGSPLSAEVREITGITDDLVAGQRFADDLVNDLAQQASLVIAHNAAFDRPFVEARFPRFASLAWACSMVQIDWQAERISARSLEYLLYKCGGWCINAHRAMDDAEGLLGLLLGQLPVSGTPIFRALLARAHEATSRVYAMGAPFDRKDLLKQRGYRWDDGSAGGCKAWWRDVPQEVEEDELAYLAAEVYPGGNTKSVAVGKVDAYSRFSVREGRIEG